ncbi:MAG TPA: hypothetical protein VFQ20_01590 [Burkholderiaceae bacterium]|nr:hypothetical protein [Burkholderiaceae bacterium]
MHSQPAAASHPAALERSAFNAAFYELGLRWHWDDATFEALAADPCERQRVRRYLEGAQSHLLRAYDADFLTDAILAAKQRFRQSLARCAPQAMPAFNWADARWGEVGI